MTDADFENETHRTGESIAVCGCGFGTDPHENPTKAVLLGLKHMRDEGCDVKHGLTLEPVTEAA